MYPLWQESNRVPENTSTVKLVRQSTSIFNWPSTIDDLYLEGDMFLYSLYATETLAFIPST